MKKIYNSPSTKTIILDGESEMLLTDSAGQHGNTLGVGDGSGSVQDTRRQQSLWDNWSE